MHISHKIVLHPTASRGVTVVISLGGNHTNLDCRNIPSGNDLQRHEILPTMVVSGVALHYVHMTAVAGKKGRALSGTPDPLKVLWGRSERQIQGKVMPCKVSEW